MLGNIDVAKEDNFIVDDDNKAYLIDAGANFLFRSLGQPRKESANFVTEMETLRDETFNDHGPDWFGDITDEEIRQQLEVILAKQDELYTAVWTLSQHLQLSDHLRDNFLQCFSDRLDVLATRYIRQPQCYAKSDKRAQQGVTSAGILTYTIINGEPFILLSKRAKHEWWDNFGGKSELGDESLLVTARREVAEESSQLFTYTDAELQDSPFHDIITGKQFSEQQLYRMYITHYHYVDPATFNDNEHTAHQWVPLKNLLAALDANEEVEVERQHTINVNSDQGSIAIYPPLYNMLQQQPVRDNLRELQQFKRMKRRHTLSYDEEPHDNTMLSPYRPMLTPAEKRQQIAAVLEKKSYVVRELKRELHDEEKLNNTRVALTQSEIHLKVLLGSNYQEDDLEQNIRCFIENHLHTNVFSRTALNEEQQQLIQYCVTLIENERKGSADDIYFYHACNNSIAFAYDVYTMLYQSLQQDAKWSAFRPDSEHFRRFLSINEFIAHYSANDTRDINNNDKNYNDCALSTNVFLFGNHLTDTSCSINYLVKNDVRRQVDLSALFTANAANHFKLPKQKYSDYYRSLNII